MYRLLLDTNAECNHTILDLTLIVLNGQLQGHSYYDLAVISQNPVCFI